MILELIKRKILLRYLNLKDVHILSKLSKGFHKLLIKKDWLPNLFTYGLRSTGLYDIDLNREEFILCCKYASFDRAINILEKQESYRCNEPYNRDNVIIRGFRELYKHKDTSEIMYKIIEKSYAKTHYVILEEAVTLANTETFLQLMNWIEIPFMVREDLKYLCDFHKKEDLKEYFTGETYDLYHEQCKFGHLEKSEAIHSKKCFNIIISRNRYEIIDNVGTNYPLDRNHFEKMCMNNAYQLIQRSLNFESCKSFISDGFVTCCSHSSFESMKILSKYVDQPCIISGIASSVWASFKITEFLFDLLEKHYHSLDISSKEKIIEATFSRSHDIRIVMYVANKFKEDISHGNILSLEINVMRHFLSKFEVGKEDIVKKCLYMGNLGATRLFIDVDILNMDQLAKKVFAYGYSYEILLVLLMDHNIDDVELIEKTFLVSCSMGNLIDERIEKFKDVIDIGLGLEKLQKCYTPESWKSVDILTKILNSYKRK